MDRRDFYDVLGVARVASTRDLKTAYRTLARRYHPDVSDDPDGERKFKELGEAYATLKSPHKRRAYDHLLSLSQTPRGVPPTYGVWLGWLLWMHWWRSWGHAWVEANE